MTTQTTTPTPGASIAAKAKNALAKAQKQGTLSGLNSADVQAFLEPYKLAIANALPNGGSPDRIIQAAVWQITNTPALAMCTAKSVIGCVLNSSLLGLNPTLKQCWYIPYRDQATFQISYTGMIALARRSGIVSDVYAHVVRKTDRFEVTYGTDKKILHVPDLNSTGDEFTHVYAVVKYTNGGTEFVVLNSNDVERRRVKSPSQRGAPNGVWAEWKQEMWQKTALKVLLKTAPLTDEAAAAMQTDGAALSPDNFQRGEIRAETVDTEHEEVPQEAADLKDIREGVQDCADLDSLQRYWEQGKDEWAKRADVVEVFNNRKKELSDGK